MAITIDISAGIDGLWIIQDNGNPADGMSELRDPNGALFQTFAHPADSVTILSRAGQNINVNFTESLGTANFTIGSLTSTTVRPDLVFVNQVGTSGIVTLTALQTITESGGDAGTDITANQLLLDAGATIGTLGNPIETQVVQLEGEANTGGIFLSNTGDLQIGGSTAELRGLFTGTSGDIAITNQGTIALFDSTNSQTIASAGNIILTAIGATANIVSTVSTDALFATGDISLSAGQDILFGTIGVDWDNDVRAGGGISVTAGRDFHIDGNADMAANDAGTASNGGISIAVGRDIMIEDNTGTDASVGMTTGTGDVTLTTGTDGTFTLAANSAAALFAADGDVTVNADRILIETDSGISLSGNGDVHLTVATAGRWIELGPIDDALPNMKLSDAELDRVFANNVIIGSASAGHLILNSAPVSFAQDNVTLEAGFSVQILDSLSSAISLTLRAADQVLQTFGTISTGALIVVVDTPNLDVAGGNSSFGGTVTVTSSTITGNADADTLGGSNAGDRLIGGAGNNSLDGLNGLDVVDYSSAPGPVDVDLDGGIASANGFGDSDLLFNIENVTGSAFADMLVGDVFANVLDGGLGGDTLIGSAGANSLDGGGGEDLVDYSLVPGPVDVDLDAGGASANGFGASDLLFNIERVFGSDFNDVLTGDAFANSLRGGAGADQLTGGDGDDTYGVDNAGDTVSETSASGGTDTVRSSIGFSLGANLENLFLIGTDAVNGTGNSLDNNLTGNSAANVLDGGVGADRMKGDGGDDTYFVDNVGDVVIENLLTEGTDTVRSSISFTLNYFVENLVLTGAAEINGTGNGLVNNLTGNNAANILNGGVGADQMKGDGGDDTYIVDHAGDVVIENSAADGTDTVRSSVTFSLAGQYLENLVLAGSAAINATGNGLANNLTGNGAANILNGGMGADRMKGDGGDDTYIVDNVGDVVIENALAEGTDTVLANVSYTLGSFVENLTLTGTLILSGTGNGLGNVLTGNNAANLLKGMAGADTLSGAGGADTLQGGIGDDTLFGGGGHDDLSGGVGQDGFRFDTALSAANNVDDILDFNVADDTIFLDRDTFTGIAADGPLAAGAFRAGTVALDADDRILYDAATGQIRYDADGVGGTAAILFATVTPGTALTSADFVGYI